MDEVDGSRPCPCPFEVDDLDELYSEIASF